MKYKILQLLLYYNKSKAGASIFQGSKANMNQKAAGESIIAAI
ncbi:MAG: hypothetical protein K0S39_2651 [Paenibacillus sp.]|nr:hypothetical protein [Paenibacillus sp.]